MNWVSLLLENIVGVSYFITTDKGAVFLRIMQFVKMKYTIIEDNVVKPNGRKGRQIEFDLTTGELFMHVLFADLNDFCKKHNISIEVNKERTWALIEYLSGSKIPDYLKSE